MATKSTPQKGAVVSEAKMPADLRKIVASSAKTKEQWMSLTPIARRDFISWIESAKQLETRKRRIDRVPDMLASGKRRPCCYAVVPMNLYRALGTLPKAKAHWAKLTPDERRDYSDWVESAKGADERSKRVEKACVMLSAGKKLPR